MNVPFELKQGLTNYALLEHRGILQMKDMAYYAPLHTCYTAYLAAVKSGKKSAIDEAGSKLMSLSLTLIFQNVGNAQRLAEMGLQALVPELVRSMLVKQGKIKEEKAAEAKEIFSEREQEIKEGKLVEAQLKAEYES